MFNFADLAIAFAIALISAFLITFPVKHLAIKWGAVDFPNHRKIHTKVTPRLGGIAIFAGAIIGLLYLFPSHPNHPEIILGSMEIIINADLYDAYVIVLRVT